MSSLLAKVMERGIFRVPTRRKRKVEVKPSDIPHLSLYGSPGRCPLAAPRCPEEKPWLIYAKQLAVANVRFASRASATATLKPRYWPISALLDCAGRGLSRLILSPLSPVHPVTMK
nr:MAG TPA: NinE [Caudoviricetes sp.]